MISYFLKTFLFRAKNWENSTFIISQLLENVRSLKFPEKPGFQQVGILRKERFLDLENYESILMFKEI